MMSAVRSTGSWFASSVVVLLGLSAAKQAEAAAQFTYDSANRLVQSTTDGAVTRYTYDALGQLVRRCFTAAAPNSTEECSDLVLDERRGNSKVLSETDGVTGAARNLYAWGPRGLAAQKAGAAPPEYSILDHLRSVRGFASSTGVPLPVVTTYDAFGNVRATQEPDGTKRSMFGYAGQMTNADGTLYLRARHYLPSTGRFLQRDSFAGFLGRPSSLDRYSYVENNPIAFVDPKGLQAVPPEEPFEEPEGAAERDPRAEGPGSEEILGPDGVPVEANRQLTPAPELADAPSAEQVADDFHRVVPEPEQNDLLKIARMKPRNPGCTPRGTVHPSWLHPDGEPNLDLLGDLSKKLNTQPPGERVGGGVRSKGPSSCIVGNCGYISRYAPDALRWPAGDVLSWPGEAVPTIPREYDPVPRGRTGDFDSFARDTQPGDVGQIYEEGSDHGATIIQTPNGPRIVDLQRGGGAVPSFPSSAKVDYR